MCSLIFLLCSAVFILPAINGKSNIIRISLYKQTPYKTIDTFKENVEDYKGVLNHFFGIRTPDLALGKLDKNVDLSAGIELGYPRQRFLVNLDFCFSGLWIRSSLCYLSRNCFLQNNSYNSKSSVDYINDILNNEHQSRSITYGVDKSYEVKGTLGFDTLWMDETSIRGVHFMQAVDIPYSPFYGVVSDGVFGLGFPSVSLKMAPPFYSMMDRGLLDTTEFSLFVGRKHQTGELIFGGRNDFQFVKDSLRFHPLNSTSDWQIKVESISFRGYYLCPFSCDTLIDAGTALIAAPVGGLKSIYRILNLDYNGEVIEVDCSKRTKMPFLNITIGDQMFSLNGFDYVIQIEDKKCVLGFMESPKESFWILGNIFLSTVYAVFNVGEMKIGFANLIEKCKKNSLISA